VAFTLSLLWCHAPPASGQAAPINDLFADRITVNGASNIVSGSNVGATLEPREALHGYDLGGRSVWWSWTAPVTGSVTVSTVGSSFDTLLGIHLGSTVSNLATVAVDDDSGPNNTSVVTFRAYAGETFQIAVDGFQQATGHIILQIGPAGYPMPAWQITNSAGQLVYSSEYTNQVVLMDFFETTCSSCIEETIDLINLGIEFRGQGFAIVGAAMDYFVGLQGLTDYQRSMKLNYTIGFTSEQMKGGFGDVPGPPTKFLVDREGKIVGRYAGGGNVESLYAPITPLLRSAPNLPLNAQNGPEGLSLTWPASEFGFHIESTPSLPSGVWTTVTNTSQVIAGQNTLLLPRTGSSQFYRLKKP
jgi:peroxiredoxin